MKKISLVAIGLLAGAFASAHFALAQTASIVKLSVPYVSEVPDGRWVGSWKNACEEASIAMVDAYYSGQKTVGIAKAKAFMQGLFNIEHKLWGSDANTDAARTLQLITDHSDFNGRIVEAPTVNAIKAEVAARLTAAGQPPKVLSGAAVVGATRATEIFEAAYDEHARRLAKLYETIGLENSGGA